MSRVLHHPPEECPPCAGCPEPWPELAPVWAPEFDPAGEPEFDPPGVPEFDPAGEPWFDGFGTDASVVGDDVRDEDGLVGKESVGFAATVPDVVGSATGVEPVGNALPPDTPDGVVAG